MQVIDEILKEIKLTDVISLLKKKLTIEKLDRFFKIQSQTISNTESLELDADNSIMMKFKTLSENSKSYDLLLILGFYNVKSYSHEIVTEIGDLSNLKSIDKIILWSVNDIDIETRSIMLKNHIDIFHINGSELLQVSHISNFYPIENVSYDYAVVINKLTELLVKRLKKLFHLVLSEIAAPIYDENYAKDKIATSMSMKFEESKLKALATFCKQSKKNDIAVDVGCGTGRHSFLLSEFFSTVYAFDFSKAMIIAAKESKRKKGIDNIHFSVSDLEYDKPVYEVKLKGKVDLIVASFGMGSFIEDTHRMFRIFSEWLKPDGQLFISFYNSNSVILNVTPNWRDTALSATIDNDNNTLRVQLAKDIVFRIFCKTYDETVHRLITQYFKIRRFFSYPTTMALLPNSLLLNETALNLFAELDESISSQKKFRLGHYNTIIAKRKGAEVDHKIYERIIKIISEAGIKFEIIDHGLAVSSEDLQLYLNVPSSMIVKTVALIETNNQKVYLVVIPKNKRIDKAKLEEYLNFEPGVLEVLSQSQIANVLGLSVGVLAPFGYENIDYAHLIIDSFLRNSDTEYLFMGVGDNTKTLKLLFKDFITLTKDYIAIDI